MENASAPPHFSRDARARLQDALLTWYDRSCRDLPWRTPPKDGGAPGADPYRVWLSEIMLQQTTVATVIPYYRAFLSRWPDVAALARAPLDDVLHAWQGLGYYARARNLHRCARQIVSQWGGRFPSHEADLRTLSGVGPYTAAAIATIAFGRKATPVDGNVVRVTARLFGVSAALPRARAEIEALAGTLTADRRPGDFAQAMMDLGATVCTAKKAFCAHCPWKGDCRAHARGTPLDYPRKMAKKKRPTRHGIAYWLRRPDGHIFFQRREEKGLLGGMMCVPMSPLEEQKIGPNATARFAPVAGDVTVLSGVVVHVFTHFRLELTVCVLAPTVDDNIPGVWVREACFSDIALPTLMKKIINHVRANELQ